MTRKEFEPKLQKFIVEVQQYVKTFANTDEYKFFTDALQLKLNILANELEPFFKEEKTDDNK